jgi:hypothetical protein
MATYLSDPRRASLLLIFILGLPVLIAVWFLPWFTTQDGPLHLYNAHILARLSSEDSIFNQYYAARGGPLPYLGGYHLLIWLMMIFSPRNADRVIITLTSLGFVASILWLRWRVAGWNGMVAIVPLAMILALTELWLLGFYPFLTGACLFSVTLGLWWVWRDDLTITRAAILAVLLVLGYFFHIVSAALTLFGIGILAVFTPTDKWRSRLIWTGTILIPVALLIISFGGLMQKAGGANAQWVSLENAWSIQEWIYYLQSPDFISLSPGSSFLNTFTLSTDFPFVEQSSSWFALFSPALWCLAGLVLLSISTLSSLPNKAAILASKHRGWGLLSLLLIVAGLWGPGAAGQGAILRERLLLLGLVSLVPVIKFDAKNLSVRVGAACLFIAAIIQIGFVLDYARLSNRTVGQFMQAGSYVGTGQRIGVVIADTKSKYVVNPVLNLSNQLGINSENIIWNNYGPAYYYFPVEFRDQTAADRWKEFNTMAGIFLSGQAEEVAMENTDRWVKAFSRINSATDVFIVWGKADWLNPINAQWFESEPVFDNGNVKVFRRKAD